MDDTDQSNNHELMDSLRTLDQKALFNQSFDYVRSRTNKQTVTIGEVLGFLINNNTLKEDKFHLGWTAMSMMRDKKESLKNKGIDDESFKKIFESIVENMV